MKPEQAALAIIRDYFRWLREKEKQEKERARKIAARKFSRPRPSKRKT